MKEILKVNNLIKKFPKAGGEIDDADAISVLKGINFDVEQGEYVGIMGKSGCGKTTLLKILGFMDQQTDGDVIFDGANTNELWKEELTDIRRRKIGFVFQDFNLMDSLSVKENIMLPVLLDKKEQKECEEKAEALEKQFGIEHLQEKNPYELSGGERQRVAILRALINDCSAPLPFTINGLQPVYRKTRFVKKFLDFLSYPRSMFTRLKEHGIAGKNSNNDIAKGQEKRIIPRRNDRYCSKGPIINNAFSITQHRVVKNNFFFS